MGSNYFDEHDCTELADGERPNHMLHLARLLIDGGFARDWGMEFDSVFAGQRKPPPASKKAVEQLPTVEATTAHTAEDSKCTVCLVAFEVGDVMKKLPCGHLFHPRCILPWLEKTNSCPLCRHELPTDDADYEEYKKQKQREKQRQFELESLHDSMFG